MVGQAVALGIGSIGAVGASTLGIPLPWMLGPIIIVTLAAVVGVPMTAPAAMRKVLMPIIGVMLGSGFYPSLVSQAANWGITLTILPFYVAAAFSVSFLIYRKIGKYDTATAYFSAAPGGLNDMMIIGTEAGGIERRIALAHASRILVVVSFVSIFFALVFDVRATGSARAYTSFDDLAAFDLIVLLGCAVAGAWIGPVLRLPAPLVLGPMLLSAIVHMTGLTADPPPTVAVNVAQLALGTVVGCRFLGVPATEVGRDIGLAAIASGAMIAVALATTLLLISISSTDFGTGFLVFAPGGLPEMSLLSLAMGADVAQVVTMHTLRIALVIGVAPIVFRMLRAR